MLMSTRVSVFVNTYLPTVCDKAENNKCNCKYGLNRLTFFLDDIPRLLDESNILMIFSAHQSGKVIVKNTNGHRFMQV